MSHIFARHLNGCNPVTRCALCHLVDQMRRKLSSNEFSEVILSIEASSGEELPEPELLPADFDLTLLKTALKKVSGLRLDTGSYELLRDPILAPLGSETPLSNFGFSGRVTKAMKYLKVVTIGDLMKVSAENLRRPLNFGRRSMRELYEAVHQVGFDPPGLAEARSYFQK